MSIWIWMSAALSSGSAMCRLPSSAIRTGSGTSMITPSSIVISVGVPQPTSSIGPNT